MAKNGMVVSAQHLAPRPASIAKDGGNAVDGRGGAMPSRCYPAAGNLGGGGFMTIQIADGRKTLHRLREQAPLAAPRKCTSTRTANVIRARAPKVIRRRLCPGTVSGL